MTGTAVVVIALVLWLFYSGWRFYRHVNWDEAPESTPDIGALRKREAELQHIQEILEEARAHNKLSQAFMEEYNRFYEEEIAAIRSVVSSKR
jgi:hypothetical protein